MLSKIILVISIAYIIGCISEWIEDYKNKGVDEYKKSLKY